MPEVRYGFGYEVTDAVFDAGLLNTRIIYDMIRLLLLIMELGSYTVGHQSSGETL